MTSASDEIWRSFVFFSPEQVVVRRGQIRRIGWVTKILETQAGQFLLGCKFPVSRGIVVQEEDPLADLPAAFFLQNVLQMHQQRWVILPKKSKWELFHRIFALGNFGAGWATMPQLYWLFLCLRIIVIFNVSVMATNRDRKSFGLRRKKFQSLLRRLTPLTFLIRVQAFRDPLPGELPHVQIFMNDGPNPFTWDGQLLSYWFSRNTAVFQD